MARKRVNKRKLKKSSSKKGNSSSFLSKFKPLIIFFSFWTAVVLGFYLIVAFIMSLFHNESKGTNFISEKIPVTSSQLSYLVGIKNSITIPKQVYNMIVSADKLLIVDFDSYPSLEGKKFYDLLISMQKRKPGLSIFIIANEAERSFTEQCPAKFTRLTKVGINVIFSDTSQMRTYRWLYSPMASVISTLLPFKALYPSLLINGKTRSTAVT